MILHRQKQKAPTLMLVWPNRHRRSHSQGFTMIELLAASTLTAMMMAFVLSAVSGLAVRQKKLAKTETSPSWEKLLIEQFHWDLTNAEIVEVQADRLLITGFGSRDWKTGNPTQQRAEIVYEVLRTNRQSRLMRHETHVSELTNINRRSQLMALGITSLIITFPDEVTNGGKLVQRVRYPNVVELRVRDTTGQIIVQEIMRWR